MNLHPDMPIVVVESDNNDRQCDDAFGQLGYSDLKEKYGVELLNLTKEPFHEVQVPGIHYSIKIPEIFFDDVFFISIANLKVHMYQKMTCVYKNQFGCVPDEIKERYHQYMEETLYSLNQLIKPDLSIIDGKIGLEGIGPVTGTPRRADIMLASDDPAAADTIAAKIMGLNPSEVPHLSYLYKKDGKTPNDYSAEGIGELPNLHFQTDNAFKLVRAKIRVTRRTDRLNKTLKRTTERVYGTPRFVRRAYGFGKRKIKRSKGK
jgi:uncharacterized protein (DUF362 family)